MALTISEAKAIKKAAAVRFRCQECGRLIPQRARRCSKCGSEDIDLA